MVDFNKLAKEIYEGEMSHRLARIAPEDSHLSTFQTIPCLRRALNMGIGDEEFIDLRWNPWWEHWRDTRAAFIERFGQTQPNIEILIIEKTLKEHFER